MIRKSFDPVVLKAHPKSVTIEKQYRLTRDENDNAIYTEVGDLNIRDYVNSFEAGCSLHSLLQRCSLMPTRDKINYLQQNASGASVDLSAFPSDLTDAFIRFKDFASSDPALVKRMSAGESIGDIIKSIVNTAISEKEVSTNGENESSNE